MSNNSKENNEKGTSTDLTKHNISDKKYSTFSFAEKSVQIAAPTNQHSSRLQNSGCDTPDSFVDQWETI